MVSQTEHQQTDPASEERWSGILKQVHEETQTGRTWYLQIGIFCAWAAGIALATGIVTVVLLLIVDLFSAGRLFTARSISDWLFWTSALLLFAGLLSPSASDINKPTKTPGGMRRSFTSQRSSSTQRSSATQRASQPEEQPTAAPEERRLRAVRKRLMRVYDPWRWRLWASSLLSFGLSVLAGLLA